MTLLGLIGWLWMLPKLAELPWEHGDQRLFQENPVAKVIDPRTGKIRG